MSAHTAIRIVSMNTCRIFGALEHATQGIPVLIGVVALGADQLSKSAVRETLPLGASIPEEGLVGIRHVANDGVIFGIDAHPVVSMVLPAVLMMASLFLCWGFLHPRRQLLNTALALFVSGGLGNLIDRIAFGHVTDFIDVTLPGGSIGVTFNVADLSVIAGAILFAVSAVNLVGARSDRQPQPGARHDLRPIEQAPSLRYPQRTQ